VLAKVWPISVRPVAQQSDALTQVTAESEVGANPPLGEGTMDQLVLIGVVSAAVEELPAEIEWVWVEPVATSLYIDLTKLASSGRYRKFEALEPDSLPGN